MAGGLRGAAVAVATALMFLVFVLQGFPYDRAAERVAAALERATGVRVRYAAAAPALSWIGPVLELRQLEVTPPGATPLAFDLARVRPALSLAWLRLAPALRIDLEGPAGGVDGVVVLGAEPGFDGELEAVDLRQLPLAAVWPGSSLSGTLDAEVDVQRAEDGARGELRFEARDGAVVASTLGMPVPFTTLSGDLRLGNGRTAELRTLAIEGPVLTGSGRGELAAAESFGAAAIDLRFELVADRRIVPALRNLGVRAQKGGEFSLRVGGTPNQLTVQ